MEEKRTFWIIAVIVALAAISATVAYVVTRLVRRRADDELGDFFDCDCDDYCDDEPCCCGCEEAASVEDSSDNDAE